MKGEVLGGVIDLGGGKRSRLGGGLIGATVFLLLWFMYLLSRWKLRSHRACHCLGILWGSSKEREPKPKNTQQRYICNECVMMSQTPKRKAKAEKWWECIATRSLTRNMQDEYLKQVSILLPKMSYDESWTTMQDYLNQRLVLYHVAKETRLITIAEIDGRNWIRIICWWSSHRNVWAWSIWVGFLLTRYWSSQTWVWSWACIVCIASIRPTIGLNLEQEDYSRTEPANKKRLVMLVLGEFEP